MNRVCEPINGVKHLLLNRKLEKQRVITALENNPDNLQLKNELHNLQAIDNTNLSDSRPFSQEFTQMKMFNNL